MARSVINLLPPELLNTQKKQRTLAIFIWFASSLLILIIVLTSAILLYKLFQVQQINSHQQTIAVLTDQINSLQTQEILLSNVRQRLAEIKQVDSQSQTALSQYALTLNIVPPGFKVLSFVNDTTNRVKVSLESTGSARLKNLFDNLTNPESAEGKIAKVELESLSRNALDKYKADLTINYK